MEENKELVEQNIEEAEEAEAADNAEAAENTEAAADTEAAETPESETDDDIQYTFVVPKGEIYKDPEDEFFEVYKAADPAGDRTISLEPPIYEATGLPDDDEIIYTFVVPKGEVYRDPELSDTMAAGIYPDHDGGAAKGTTDKTIVVERKPGEAEAVPAEDTGVPAETIVVDKSDAGSRTHYGLPAGHPEMGELAEKQEARRLYKQRKTNRFRTRFYVLITSVVLLAFWLVLSNSGLFTIDAIEVQGNSHYTAEEIINMGHASPGRNIIYKANIKETTEYLENNPYIKHAEVRRRLPSTLVIKVTERQERMAFKYDDDYLIMDEDGILLKKTRNTPKITVIQGVVVSKIKLGEKIGAENSRTLDKALDIIKSMIKADLFFVKVDLSKEKSLKAYIYDTLVVNTDYEALITNMENGKLHLVIEKLFDEGIKRGTITFEEDGSASFMPMF